MVEVTDSARRELKSILSSNVDNSYALLRLIDRGEGSLGLGIDIESPGDELIKHDGEGLLLVECELASNLDGITIDIDDTAEGPQLVTYEKS